MTGERQHCRNGARHYVYRLEGPSGIYIGCTSDPVTREKFHRRLGRPPARGRQAGIELLVHRAMQHDGEESYDFRIVSIHPTRKSGLEAEYTLVSELRAEGRRVFNVKPRLPQHVPWHVGRTNFIVINGERHPATVPTAHPASEAQP